MEAVITIAAVATAIILLILYVRGCAQNARLKEDRDFYQRLSEASEQNLINCEQALSRSTRAALYPLGKYIIVEDKWQMAFTVGRRYLHSSTHESFIAIKNFYYFDTMWAHFDTYNDEDRELARRDAEELIDKLNEK